MIRALRNSHCLTAHDSTSRRARWSAVHGRRTRGRSLRDRVCPVLWGILLCCFSGVLCQAAEPIPIAAVFSATGVGAEEDAANFRITHLAAAQINERGGVLGRPLAIVELDTGSTPLGAREAARQAVAAGVTAVIGPSWSSQAMAMGPVLQEAGIPMLGTATTAPPITHIGDYIFRVCYTDVFQASALAGFARQDLRAGRAALLFIAGDVYSEGLSNRFAEAFTAVGGSVVERRSYLQSAMDFSTQLRAVHAAAPDLVFVSGYARDSGLILKQARKIGLEMPFLGGDGWNGLQYYLQLELAEGENYYVSHWHPDIDSEASRAFAQVLRSLLGNETLAGIAVGNVNSYDAVGLIADAITRANSIERGAVRDALAATRNYPGVTGTISYGSARDPRKPIVVLQLTAAGVRFVKQIDPPR